MLARPALFQGNSRTDCRSALFIANSVPEMPQGACAMERGDGNARHTVTTLSVIPQSRVPPQIEMPIAKSDGPQAPPAQAIATLPIRHRWNDRWSAVFRPSNEPFRNALMSLFRNRQRDPGSKLPLVGVFILGIAFSAFFDGILLHQVLQWHHLLSLAQGELFRDVRVQILADGLFHVASYLLAAGGLLLLWHGRRTAPADRIIFAWAVLGFAAWQFADIILVHWAVGLHRTRIGVSALLLWDIGWLVAFGMVPLVAGLWLLRNPPRGGDRIGRSSQLMIGLAVVFAGAISALPPLRGSNRCRLQGRHESSRIVRSGCLCRGPGDLERAPRRNHDYRFADTERRQSLYKRGTSGDQRRLVRLLRSDVRVSDQAFTLTNGSVGENLCDTGSPLLELATPNQKPRGGCYSLEQIELAQQFLANGQSITRAVDGMLSDQVVTATDEPFRRAASRAHGWQLQRHRSTCAIHET
jgi:uncharacterized membrane protein